MLKNQIRETELVIKDIKKLVSTKGYIYALFMILFEDFHVNPEEMHKTDARSRLSVKETSLLLGFLIQDKISFLEPNALEDLVKLKQKTYELMSELQESLKAPFFEGIVEIIKEEYKIKGSEKREKLFFEKGNRLIEPIFYSGDGLYDFQYLDFLDHKYKYDKDWLLEKKNFDIEGSKEILNRIKKILQDKAQKVRLYSLKEKKTQIIEEMKKKYPKEDCDKQSEEFFPIIEFYQYRELFSEIQINEDVIREDVIREKMWSSFYKGLIDLFTIKRSDFDGNSNIDSFLKNFLTIPKKGFNSDFKLVGNFNWFNARPIIQLDEDRYCIPILFSLFEAVYESPFYWMWKEDENYRDIAAKNRGETGEEITYKFLSQIFGKNRTFRSVRITDQEGNDKTDIDVLCILGSKALCVQVKSKKLTELSRTGNNEQLKKDFKGAIQDAYDQGLISRKEILNRSSKFFDIEKKEIKFSEGINEVYIIGVTMENYPSLTLQSHIMLNKEDSDPFPLFLTIFDLDLLAHYLKDPYDFLYYVKQRISLMGYFMASEEIHFLGYHLNEKLWKIPNTPKVLIDISFGQLIDRNYYPLKAGLEISDEGDSIKNRWKNESFEMLCNQLKNLTAPQITDIIFHLLDCPNSSIDNLVKTIIETKQKTLQDGKFHNFTMPFSDSSFGVTYVSSNLNDSEELKKKILTLSLARKYKSKATAWVGFGSLKSSNEIIDAVVFNNEPWKYSKDLEDLAAVTARVRNVRLGKKIGRNEKCFCGSMLKYKKCCG